MTKFSKLKDLPRRPLRTFVGSMILSLHVIGPVFMCYSYYQAIQGNLTFIVFSILQIVIQIFIKKTRWYIDLIQKCDTELYFDDFTFETHDGKPVQDNSKSLFAVHPHGIFSLGLFMNNHRDHFGRNAVVCGSRMVFMTPIMGILHKMGGMVSVDPSSLKSIMSTSTNVALLPGGFEEATLTTKKENRAFINSRKGFIKYAIRYGYKIYPTFIFGENQLYNTLDSFTNFRLLLNKMKLVGVIFWSRFFLLPECKVALRTVVGHSITLPHDNNPSDELVSQYHFQYIDALKELHKNYSQKYNIKDKLILY